MKLITYRPPRANLTSVGLLHGTHVIDVVDACKVLSLSRPLVTSVQDIVLDWEGWLATLDSIAATSLAQLRYAVKDLSSVTLCAPLPLPTSITCVGLNYRDHATETGAPTPTEPILFAKSPTAVIGPNDDIVIPSGVTALDYEAELALVIGAHLSAVDSHAARAGIAGLVAFNDVSARDWQARQGQWMPAKSFRSFAPMGPWLATLDEVEDPQALAIECRVNDRVLQRSSTQEMIFTCVHLVSYISKIWTLRPGDVVATGTPAGVGYTRTPPILLQPGDLVEVSIDALGSLRNRVRSQPETDSNWMVS